MDALRGRVGTTMEWTTTSTTTIDDGCIDGNDVDDVNECHDRPVAYLTSSSPSAISSFSGNLLTSLFIWRRNKFGHGIFIGRVRGDSASAIVSVRLKSQGDLSRGIDLCSGGFGGLVCCICGNGGKYVAFLRTEA